MPSNITFHQAATLSCSGVTAWNALYGNEGGKGPRPGDWVLTIGSGGVSCAAVQFAKGRWCEVISTTSSEKKAEFLRKLGADHVINYREVEKWGEQAKKNQCWGVDFVVEVGGPSNLFAESEECEDRWMHNAVGLVGGPVAGAGYLVSFIFPPLFYCFLLVVFEMGVWGRASP